VTVSSHETRPTSADTLSLHDALPISWSPQGDRIAYFVRTEKHKTLILHNAVTGRIDRRIALRNVDMPESPDISPDGRTVAFSAGSEEHTSELQSRENLVCRHLLENKT